MNRDVSPDEYIIKHIFASNEPQTVSIILQNWDKCIFKAEFPKNLNLPYHSCVVRLEDKKQASETFNTVAAMQEIAARVIPDLVPRTFQLGNVTDGQGRNYHFSVVEFMEGDTLEDVWEQIDPDGQESIVNELIMVLGKLHTIRSNDATVHAILQKALLKDGGEALTTFQQHTVFGGPHTGFLDSGSALLYHVMEKRQLKRPSSTIKRILDPQGISVESKFEELGSIFISDSDISKLPREAVLCHNDLTPRNIILQRQTLPSDKPHYKLAGIIDWELAGFYPASYELSLQDTYLGGASRRLSFYLLLKRYMKELVPRSSSQVTLLQALEIIFLSQQRLLLDGFNIPAHFRKRLIDISKLVRDRDPYAGWTKSFLDESCIELSGNSLQNLENEIVQEMAERREMKRKEKS